MRVPSLPSLTSLFFLAGLRAGMSPAWRDTPLARPQVAEDGGLPQDATRFALRLHGLPCKRPVVDLRQPLAVVSDDDAYRRGLVLALATQQASRGGLLVLDGWDSASTASLLQAKVRVNKTRNPAVVKNRLLRGKTVYTGPRWQDPRAKSYAAVEQVLKEVLRVLAYRRLDPTQHAPLLLVLQHVTPWLPRTSRPYLQDLWEQAPHSGVMLVAMFSGEEFAAENHVSHPHLAYPARTLAIGPLRHANWAPVLEHPLAQQAGLDAGHLSALRGPVPRLILQT